MLKPAGILPSNSPRSLPSLPLSGTNCFIEQMQDFNIAKQGINEGNGMHWIDSILKTE
jgi:hypothetical protein